MCVHMMGSRLLVNMFEIVVLSKRSKAAHRRGRGTSGICTFMLLYTHYVAGSHVCHLLACAGLLDEFMEATKHRRCISVDSGLARADLWRTSFVLLLRTSAGLCRNQQATYSSAVHVLFLTTKS